MARAFDRERAIFPDEALAFIQATQAKVWEKLEALHGEQTGMRVLESLCKWLDTHGTLATLRHGFKCFGKTLRIAFFRPAHGLNPELEARYQANRLGLTRQLHFSPKSEKSLDVVLSVNGIPVVTLELKNPLSGQTAANAIHQYRHDRDPREPIFVFTKRALVHFAVDTEEAHMATRLAGPSTHFLPFNRGGRRRRQPARPGAQLQDGLPVGRSAAARQPARPARPLSASRCEEKVTDDGKKVRKESLIFPRYHQLQAVRQMVAAAASEGVGHNYLVEHSAGSGKSNTIAWLAHRLSSLHNRGRAAVRQRGGDHRPRGAGPAVAEHHLPVRPPPGRGAEDRRGFAPAGRGAGSRVCRSSSPRCRSFRSCPGSWPS
jgi:type I restriction enzyme R subunit